MVQHWLKCEADVENGYFSNLERLPFGNEPYVFASQTKHLFYVDNPRFKMEYYYINLQEICMRCQKKLQMTGHYNV